jgi:hypothetical protein
VYSRWIINAQWRDIVGKQTETNDDASNLALPLVLTDDRFRSTMIGVCGYEPAVLLFRPAHFVDDPRSKRLTNKVSRVKHPDSLAANKTRVPFFQ